MGKRMSFSGQHLQLGQISIHHGDIKESLRNYFSLTSIQFPVRFNGYTTHEVHEELLIRLGENDRSSIFKILSSLEATFRIDYLQRCYLRKKDALSRAFREIHRRQGHRVRLEDEILSEWRDKTFVSPNLIGDIRGAFKYRHWLAHGRYWIPKHQKYDYDSVYLLADQVCNTFPFEGVS